MVNASSAADYRAQTAAASATRWFVAASWLRSRDDKWRLTGFVPNADHALHFEVIPARYETDRSRKVASGRAWGGFMGHAAETWKAAVRSAGSRGIITAFPQLAAAVGLRKRLSNSDIPVLAWTFNMGRVYPGIRGHVSRIVLRRIDRFIVHSRAEIAAYSEWLDIPPERFTFLPFETPIREIEVAEDTEHPFIVSLGSAQRDYALLFAVLAELPLPAVVVAAPHAVAGLTAPPNVTVRSGLSASQCFELIQRARFVVIPVANQTTASGQVTMLDAMMYARPVIITSCPGSVDYISDGVDGLLVREGDRADLRTAMQRLWEDEPLRRAMGAAARQRGEQSFSERAIGIEMGRILRDLGAGRGRA